MPDLPGRAARSPAGVATERRCSAALDLGPRRDRWSEDGILRWFKASDEFAHFLKPGQPLDRRSLAYDYFEGGDVPTKPELVAAGAWLSDSKIDERATIVEESRPMPSYGGVLTLLWIRDPIDTPPDEDGSLLEPLAPEDFTLRRRRWPRR